MGCYSHLSSLSLFSGPQCHLADIWFLVGFAPDGGKDPIPSTQALRPDLQGKFTWHPKQTEPLGWGEVLSLGPVGPVCEVSDAIAEAQICIYVLGYLRVGRFGVRK